MSEPNIQEAVKQKYGEAAKRAASGGTACCAMSRCLGGSFDYKQRQIQPISKPLLAIEKS